MEHEPRVERIAAESPAAEPVREAFEALIRDRGKVPNLFRVAAHRPEIMRTLQAHLASVMGPGEVSQALKELLSVRVSRINNCEY
jgi:alkylhydroperoxidase family enzyme